MKINRYFERIKVSPASLDEQGIVAVPKAYFAKQSMERVRRGTAKSLVFCVAKNGQKNQIKEIEKLLACITCRKWKVMQLNKYDINIT